MSVFGSVLYSKNTMKSNNNWVVSFSFCSCESNLLVWLYLDWSTMKPVSFLMSGELLFQLSFIRGDSIYSEYNIFCKCHLATIR